MENEGKKANLLVLSETNTKIYFAFDLENRKNCILSLNRKNEENVD